MTDEKIREIEEIVLNLIITGIPSIPMIISSLNEKKDVLNLIITGIPSILLLVVLVIGIMVSFKPYYNWNTFNTLDLNKNIDFMVDWFTF